MRFILEKELKSCGNDPVSWFLKTSKCRKFVSCEIEVGRVPCILFLPSPKRSNFGNKPISVGIVPSRERPVRSRVTISPLLLQAMPENVQTFSFVVFHQSMEDDECICRDS